MFWLIVLFAFLALTVAPIIPYFTFGEDYIMTKEIGYDTIMLGTVIFGVLAATLFVTDEIEGRTAITLMSNQTISSQKGEPRERAMPAGVRKIPMATTSPTTSAVTATRPS